MFQLTERTHSNNIPEFYSLSQNKIYMHLFSLQTANWKVQY